MPRGWAGIGVRIGVAFTALAAFVLPVPDAARAADANGSSDLFRQLYANPGNVQLNLLYAQQAETRGEYRKALTTYERVLTLDPTNPAARAGLTRMRNLLAPDFTNVTLFLGGGWESNPLQRPDGAPQPDSATGFGALALRDERRLGAMRWRSHLSGGGAFFPDADEVNAAFVAGDVGPLLQATPSIAVRPMVLGAYRVLDGTTLFGEIGGALEFEGVFEGARQAVRIGAVWREYGEEWVSDGGVVFDVAGRFGRGSVFREGDALVFRPALRYSGVDNQGAIFVPADFAPGRYFQLGARLDYYVPVTARVSVGAHIALYQRWFDSPGVIGGDDREDTFVAPGASLTVGEVFTEAVDLTIDYTYQHNASNVDFREFDNHVLGARLAIRF